MRLIGKCKAVGYTRQKNVYGSPSHKSTNYEIEFIINNYYDMTVNFKKI